MASATLAAWKECIKALQQLVDIPGAAFDVGPLTSRMTMPGLLTGSPPPPEAWKTLVQEVQVTRQLTALCIQAQQLSRSVPVRHLVANMLARWLHVSDTINASSQPALAASLQQQLQGSGLMKHMGAMLTHARDSLTAAAAAACEEPVPSSTTSSSSPYEHPIVIADSLSEALELVNELLHVCVRACWLLSKTPTFRLEAALPAAPAAVGLILTTFQTISKLQQLAGSEDTPEAVLLLAGSRAFQTDCSKSLGKAQWAMLELVVPAIPSAHIVTQPGVAHYYFSPESVQQALPAACELLACRELVPCLTISLLVAALWLDTAGASGFDSSRKYTPSSSQVRVLSGNINSSMQTTPTRFPSQQSAATAAASTLGHHQPGSSSSSSGRLGNGISLDSLTPLSRDLLGLLGVEQEVLLKAVSRAATWGTSPVSVLDNLISTYSNELSLKVDELSISSGATQKLLQLVETDMLLGLAMHQLTASIPDSYPRAQAAREVACKLNSSALQGLSRSGINLHKLPLSAAYTGPQLALQVMPSPLQPPAVSQAQQADQPQWYTVTPTAELLTELLPLLTSYCLTRVQQQQQHQHKQKLQAELQEQLQQAARGEVVQGLPVAQLVALGSATHCLVPDGVQDCILLVRTLLGGSEPGCAVVPDPTLTAAEVQASAANAASAASDRLEDGYVPYRCVLHAPDAAMQYAAGVVCMCEALLRDAAASCEAAAQLHADREWAAAADAALAEKGTSACISSSDGWFAKFGTAAAQLAEHEVTGELPYHPSALALAALSAGPGSELQQRLFSLLRSMVKLGGASAAAGAPSRNAYKSVEVRENMLMAAALVAAPPQPGVQAAAGSDSHSAAVSKLPGLFILGSCCMAWARQLKAPAVVTPQQPANAEFQSMISTLSALFGVPANEPDPAEEAAKPHVAEVVLPPVQQWLQASSTQEQLVAAGYAPQALPQQLQQLVAALQAFRDNADSSQPDEGRLEAAQQLQAAGSALCSFAVPCLCNNPACPNLSGLTDVGLVSGRSCVCGGCRVARYCGRACQRAMWKQHKPLCAALAAAAAATAAAAAVTTASAGAAAPPATSP